MIFSSITVKILCGGVVLGGMTTDIMSTEMEKHLFRKGQMLLCSLLNMKLIISSFVSIHRSSGSPTVTSCMLST